MPPIDAEHKIRQKRLRAWFPMDIKLESSVYEHPIVTILPC